jgi:hypothetical protein
MDGQPAAECRAVARKRQETTLSELHEMVEEEGTPGAAKVANAPSDPRI